MPTRFATPLHPGFPSRTPTKGSVIAAEVNQNAASNDETCIPPHTVVFGCNNQSGTITQVQPKIVPGEKFRIAGVAIAGVQSPEDARTYPDSDGRFGIINAGQARLVAKKFTTEGKVVSFKPMDQIYVKIDNVRDLAGNDTQAANNHDCGFQYANKTEYRQPVMIDYPTYKALVDTNAGEANNYDKLGSVVGCTENSDLLTVELKIQ